MTFVKFIYIFIVLASKVSMKAIYNDIFILLVSVELDEIFSLSDRIAVMFDGQIMGERIPSETNT